MFVGFAIDGDGADAHFFRGADYSDGYLAAIFDEQLFNQIASLSPTTNVQRFGQARVLELLTSVGETRRLLSEQAQVSLSWLFLIILGAWLTLLFFGFGLFARFNPTVIVALSAGAISVAAAVFLILEMHQPYHGWMQVSSAPLRNALSQMNE